MVYKARNNSEIIRDNVILWIAEAVNKGDVYKHTVDLSDPDLVILVEIIKASQLLCELVVQLLSVSFKRPVSHCLNYAL